jgi:hypothetical protein
MGICTIFGISATFLAVLQCRPVAKAWNHTIEGTCLNQARLYQAGAVINLVSDFVVIAIPLPTLWMLHMPPRQKMAVSLILSVGLM